MTLTKADITERLIDELDLNKREAKSLVENFFEEIRAALEQGEQVKLSGFGNFDLRDKHPRPGRNPRTGEEHTAHSPYAGFSVLSHRQKDAARAGGDAHDS